MWKFRIGFLLLVLLNLGAQLGVLIARQAYSPFMVLPSSYQVLLHASAALAFGSFGISLFVLCFARMPTPWLQISCSLWAALSSMMGRWEPISRNVQDVAWWVLYSVASLWAGYALFVLSRWHFGLEFAKDPASPTKRTWILTPTALVGWGVILLVAFVGRMLLAKSSLIDPANPAPLWSALFAYALPHAIITFPLFGCMLLRRWAWTCCALLTGLFITYALTDTIPIAPLNPPFALEKTLDHAITLAIFLANAIALRSLGLRWQAAEPWPAKARPAMETAPNPFA